MAESVYVYMYSSTMTSYTQQLLQRVDDLVGPVVPEDVDDLAMLRLPSRVHDISQREWLEGGNRRLARRRTLGLGICEDL
jgi:hypothetical protein